MTRDQTDDDPVVKVMAAAYAFATMRCGGQPVAHARAALEELLGETDEPTLSAAHAGCSEKAGEALPLTEADENHVRSLMPGGHLPGDDRETDEEEDEASPEELAAGIAILSAMMDEEPLEQEEQEELITHVRKQQMAVGLEDRLIWSDAAEILEEEVRRRLTIEGR